MPFGDFKELQDVAVAYRIALRKEPFMEPIPVDVDTAFQKRLEFFLKNVDVGTSEQAVCEFMIAPILQTIWMAYSEFLTIWSHVPLGMREPLMGIADYLFCRRGPLGLVRDRPYIVVAQARKDDFEAGWGECLAAMVAAQRMNGQPAVTIYGCVSNGLAWEFGKLGNQVFIEEFRQYTITALPDLVAALNYLFKQAQQQVAAFAA